MHGGKTPSGIASPHFVHGRRMRYCNLPPHLAERYKQAVDDPNLLSLRDEIGVLEARLADLTERTGDRIDLTTWETLRTLGGTPAPPKPKRETPRWQGGWDDEDEGEWLLLAAQPLAAVPEQITRPRVALRAIEITDSDDTRAALWRRYNALNAAG